MLRRGVFYSHRDLNWILDQYETGTPFALYTGRGPSSGIHIGHMLPWFFTKWLQEKFHAKLYFQMTDDEKFLFKDFDNLEDATKVGYDNILDIIAMGFDPKLTRIFLDTEYIHHLYPIAVEVAKRITYSTTQAVFGFQNANNVGEIFYTRIQAAPAFIPTGRAPLRGRRRDVQGRRAPLPRLPGGVVGEGAAVAQSPPHSPGKGEGPCRGIRGPGLISFPRQELVFLPVTIGSPSITSGRE